MANRPHESYVKMGLMGAVAKWSKEPPYEIRFWKRVAVGASDQCWLWLRGINKKTGYGKTKKNGQWTSAHRVAYQLEKGEIPDGKCVLHSCDNRACCNPDHLFVGTHRDNIRDAVKKGRADPRWLGKLSDNDAAKIRDIGNKMTRREIGNLFGVHASTITDILNGKSHKPHPSGKAYWS